MALEDLSNEILLKIIEVISVDDVEHFSIISSRIYSLASARLARHKTFKSMYSYVKLTHTMDDDTSYPTKLLDEISKDYHIADYVRYMFVVCGDIYAPDEFVSDASRLDTARNLDVESFTRTAPYFSDPVNESHRQSCIDDIKEGKESAALELLLVSLPNLERLRFSEFDPETTSSLAPILHSGALRNLSTVESFRSDTEDEDSIDGIMMFALAPSVRTLKAERVGESESIADIPAWRTAVSNVECIEITSGAVGVDNVKTMMRPLRKLREFRYQQQWWALDSEIFDMRAWVRILARSVGDTLEVLSLTNPEGNSTAMKSFKGFKKLRELEIEIQCLIPDDDDEDEISNQDSENGLEEGFYQPEDEEEVKVPRRLIDMLPKTIETVTLLATLYEREAKLALRDLAAEKHRLPDLKKLIYGGRTLDQGLENELKAAGITTIRKETPTMAKHVQFWVDDPPPFRW